MRRTPAGAGESVRKLVARRSAGIDDDRDVGPAARPVAAGNSTISLQQKVEALCSPLAYDQPPRSVQAIETHFAWVFLVDDFAYKLKKPVLTEYLDLSTLAARQRNCAEEFRLNQRLAQGIYLAVVPLMQGSGGLLHAGGEGVVVDWLVKMRRLPSDLMLDCQIRARQIDSAALAALGRRLAQFYQVQQAVHFEPRAYLARINSRIDDDHSELLAPDLSLPSALVESVAAAQHSASLGLQRELMLRAEQQLIVEAHGDLRPEHICLSDPPCVIDSLEFSQDLRTLDPGEELAFLDIECRRLGNPGAAQIVLDSYRSESRDPIAPQLLDLYRSRRASVRAKLVAWHLRDPAVSGLADWNRQAREYLDLAVACAESAWTERIRTVDP